MRKMKDSGVAWLESIPETWNLLQLGSLFLEHKHKNVGMQSSNLLSLSYGKIIQKNINATDGLLPESFEGYNVIDAGDIVLRLTDLQNDQRSLRVGLCGESGIITSAYTTLRRRNDALNSKYFYYLLHSYDIRKGFYGMGAGVRQGLNYAGVRKIMLTVPPESEQTAIAECLDRKTAQVDALISNVQAQIEKLKAYKQSLITEVVTKGLDPNVPMKDSRVDVYPYMPAHWNVQKTLTVLSMPITDGPHTTPELISDGIPFVSAEAVSCGNGKIDFSHIRGYISEEFYNECCKKYIPKLYDIYMIKSGATTGKVSIVDTDKVFTIWSPLAVFRCDPNVGYFKFIFYFLQSSAYQRQVQFGWTYGTQQNIGMRTLERLKIFVPPYNEQVQIAEYLDNKCVQIDQLISIKQSKIEKLEQYKRSLIYEYVTGKKEVS